MRRRLSKKKLVVQICVLIAIAVLTVCGYLFWSKQHDKKLVNNMIAVKNAVEKHAAQTLATPTTLGGVDVDSNDTKDLTYFPAVQSYEYFICGKFQQASTDSAAVSEIVGRKTFEEAVAKAKKSALSFDVSNAAVLSGDKMQSLHKKGTNCYYFESSVVKYEYDHPIKVCGGKYSFPPGQEQIVGLIGNPTRSLQLINAVMAQHPIAFHNQQDVKPIDISKAKIVDINCNPKSLRDLNVNDFVYTFRIKNEPEYSVQLVQIVKDF